MNKLLSCLLIVLSTTGALIAQQHRYTWKIGLHAGLSNYYGDLSHQIWDLPQQFQQPINDLNFLSYGLSIEYHASKTFGLRLLGMKSQFKASDRTYSNGKNYNRALNVQTDLIDASLLGMVYFDDGIVFNSRSVVSPYFMFGGGLSYFENKGDLLSADNGRYYYWSDKTIRTQDENGPNTNTAQIITQDYQYETDLRSLQTEGKHYDPITWNVALGLGVKFRLSKRFHLQLEALIRYTGTDYLDDVSDNYLAVYNDNFQAYAANPSTVNRSQRGDSPTMNDWYSSVGLSVHYSFGQKTYAIRPAIIYTENLLAVDSMVTNTTTSKIDSPVISTTTIITTTTTNTNTIDSVVVPIELAADTMSIVDSLPTINASIKDSVLLPNTIDTIVIDSIESTLPKSIDSIIYSDSSKLVIDSLTQDSSLLQVDSMEQTTINNLFFDDRPYVNTIHQMQLNQQQQKYEYELKLQQQKYEGLIREQQLLNDLEKAKKRTAPNTEEQELKFKLELQKQHFENQLKEQLLLNQLEKEKNRPAPSTLERDLKIQQQEFDAKLKLQQQSYEYQLKLQQLQNALKLERLKNGDTLGYFQKLPPIEIERTRIIEPQELATTNNTVSSEQLDQLLTAIEQQQQQINALIRSQNNQPVVIQTPIVSNKTTSSKPTGLESLNNMQAEQNRLRLQIKELELALAAQPTTTKTIRDTVKIVQRDSVYIDNGNPTELTNRLNQQQRFNNDLVQKLTLANQKSNNQQQVIDSLQQVIAKNTSQQQVTSGGLEAFLSQKKSTYITKIYFSIGKSSLTVQAKETLTTLVHHLEHYPNVRFWVKGFASKTGKTAINERLSAERALEVANFLKQSNIQAERIKTTPLGEQNSQSDNELDRRAEVHLSF